MALAYPLSAIPPADRCPTCGGSGDHWENVYDPKHDEWLFEPVAECGPCRGTGVTRGRPLPLPHPPSWMPRAGALEVGSWEP